MAIEFKTADVVTNTSVQQPVRISRIEPLPATGKHQTLPHDGKELPPEEKVNEAKLGEAVQEINDHLQQVHRELRFNIDKDSGRTVIKVVDAETKEVIRQIPDEEALRFAQRLNEGIGFKLLNAYS